MRATQEQLMETPVEMAPPGRRDLDVELGQEVRFGHVLERFEDVEVADTDPGFHWIAPPQRVTRGWRRVPVENGRGMVSGAHTLQSGEYRGGGGFRPDTPFGPEEGGEQAYLKVERTHRAYLVAFDLWRKPVFVLSDDIEKEG